MCPGLHGGHRCHGPAAGSADHSRPTDPQRQGRAQAASRGEGPGGQLLRRDSV